MYEHSDRKSGCGWLATRKVELNWVVAHLLVDSVYHSVQDFDVYPPVGFVMAIRPAVGAIEVAESTKIPLNMERLDGVDGDEMNAIGELGELDARPTVTCIAST